MAFTTWDGSPFSVVLGSLAVPIAMSRPSLFKVTFEAGYVLVLAALHLHDLAVVA